jgi:hypothetical protein
MQTPSVVARDGRVWLALLTLYFVWGSTYLGIELTGETIPPLLAVSTRFVAAGAIMVVVHTQRTDTAAAAVYLAQAVAGHF